MHLTPKGCVANQFKIVYRYSVLDSVLLQGSHHRQPQAVGRHDDGDQHDEPVGQSRQYAMGSALPP